jgi:hypothetical protein
MELQHTFTVPVPVDRAWDALLAAGWWWPETRGGIFHGPVTDDSGGPLEITLPVDGLADLHGELRGYRLPGRLVANRYPEGPGTRLPEILALHDEVHSRSPKPGALRSGRHARSAHRPRAIPSPFA